MPRKSLLHFESYKRGLAASTVCNLAVQASGFAVLLLFTSFFGAGPRTDVFLYMSGAISLVIAFVTGLNGTVIIPEYMRLDAREGRPQAMAFANGWLVLSGSVAAAAGLCLLLFPAAILRATSRFDEETIASGQAILILLAPSLLGEVAVSAMTEILAANKFFTVPMITALVNRGAQVACLVALHSRLDVRSMALGSLLAYAVQVPALGLLLSRFLRWDFGTARWRGFGRAWKNAGIASIGNLLTSLAQMVPLYMITGLGPGVVSAMNYAQRINNIPQAFLVSHVSSLTGIKLNEIHARGESGRVDAAFQRSARGLVFILTPLAAFLFLNARAIVGVLLERGSFDAHAGATAAMFLRYMALTLPLLGINTITARLFMSAQKIKAAVWFQTAQNLILATAMYVGIRRFGAPGYAGVLVLFLVWNTLAILPLLRAAFPACAMRRRWPICWGSRRSAP
ncbi:MAG: lipid II flippase MurJ [Kiritimatiellia bacterium]